jgi:hypothetical protein
MSTARGPLGIGHVVRKHAPAERNGELVDELLDDQAESMPSPKRTRRKIVPPEEKGRGRNVKIPDGLFDELCQYALKKKVPTVVAGKPATRAMTISEVVCVSLLKLLRADERSPKGTPSQAGQTEAG